MESRVNIEIERLISERKLMRAHISRDMFLKEIEAA